MEEASGFDVEGLLEGKEEDRDWVMKGVRNDIGVREQVQTRHGVLHVTISGDRSKTPCVTYHDVGLNHKSCFASLLVCDASRTPSIFQNMCLYHIDAPGSEEQGNDVIPQEILPMTMNELVEQVEDVIQHYQLAPCLGMGVGAGGYILALHSTTFPTSVFGLVLLSPACLRASWWEWSFGTAVLWYMKLRGLDRHAADHFVQRLTSGRSSDLGHTLRHAMLNMSSTGVQHYLQATLSRPDLTPLLSKLNPRRLLLLWGYEALYKPDSQEMNRTLSCKDKIGWAEIDRCGVLLTEECPFRVLEEMKCYFQALQLHGYCLEWSFS